MMAHMARISCSIRFHESAEEPQLLRGPQCQSMRLYFWLGQLLIFTEVQCRVTEQLLALLIPEDTWKSCHHFRVAHTSDQSL